MNYYFMPRVAGLKGAITLANFPPAADDSVQVSRQTAYVTWSDGCRWHFRSLGRLEPGTTATYLEGDLPAECPADATPFFTLCPFALPDTADILPLSDHLDSTPMWRGNIQLRSVSTSVSYLGEYPRQMIGNPRGTMLSYATMMQASEGVVTDFLLANLRLDPSFAPADVYFFASRSGCLLKQGVVSTNRVSVVGMGDVDLPDGEMVVAVSAAIAGVPLYLTRDPESRHLSFEHTHPPAEMIVGGGRMEWQRSMKSYWLARVPK